MRLDRILANSGLGTRKEVKEFIRKGRISLRGEILRSGKIQISDADKNDLLFDNEAINVSKHLYYIMNKPTGFITSMDIEDPNALVQILPDIFLHKKIMPVGRLDKDTSGLLIFTNNGELMHRLLSPKYKIPRVYYLEVDILDHVFNEDDIEEVKQGVWLNEEEQALPAELEILSDTSTYLTLYEGKFHEVKRIMHALGKEVTVLHRVSYGSIELQDEAESEIRELNKSECLELLESVRMKSDKL